MPTNLYETLDETLRAVRTRALFVMTLDVSPLLKVGPTPAHVRRVGVVTGGRFEGERLSGVVLDGGADWQTVRTDGATTLDVRLVLKTSDDELIAMTYRGIRHGPPEVMAKIDSGQNVDPSAYYFRITPTFETASPRLGWLDRVLAVGIGHRRPEGPVYSVFELL